MTVSAPAERTSRASRRVGYAFGAGIDLVLLYLVNVSPGWDAVPFLTNEMPQVLGWVNASLLAGVVANLVYLVWDAPPVRALGDTIVGVVGLVAAIRVWQVFPFSFDDNGFDWAQFVRVLLVLGIAGTAIAVVVQIVNLVKVLLRR